MKRRVGFFLAGCFIISSLVVSVANAGSFTIDDSAEGVSTYWGGLIDWRTTANPNDLRPSQKDILGGAAQYSVESLKVSTTATSLTAVLTGPFFSFTTNSAQNTYNIYSGDLFLSTNGWNPLASPDGHYNQDSVYTGGETWEYVLSMDGANTGTSGAINLYKIQSTGSIIFPENVLPNPGSYRTGQEYQYKKGDNQPSLGSGTWEIDDDTLTFSLSNVTLAYYHLDGALGVHWGMTCGNDVVEGFGTPVPEPTTMFLFGAGILGLAGLRRKK